MAVVEVDRIVVVVVVLVVEVVEELGLMVVDRIVELELVVGVVHCIVVVGHYLAVVVEVVDSCNRHCQLVVVD